MLTRLVVLIWLALIGPVLAQPAGSFDAFLADFRGEAVAAGVDSAFYDAITSGMTPDPRVPKLVETQPEFTTPIWDYLDTRISAGRIARGKTAMARQADLFAAVGQAYGVDPYVLGAIWGMETDYGAVLSNDSLIRPIVRSLATVAWQRRSRFVEDKADFIAALKLAAANGGTSPVGSWAGAIGHLQVNPANVLAHGTDGDGDGRVDLHASLADALVTSAVYLRRLGYQPGLDWGFEVVVPDGFDYLLASREQLRPVAFYAERGIVRVANRQFADLTTPVFLYVPAGKDGPNFLMTANYLVFKGYNFSDSYAMAVAHLTDRLKGSGPFVTPWPRNTQFPNLAQRRAIQQALQQLGHYDGAVDGRIGPITQAAYARFQARRGEIADGFVTRDAYEALTAAIR
ncbi:membrane-bound lytic murein transglycosylase B [Devosia subaequoris]|uniref:Membrane-bound lytic murein transglycosylase B n=1 Tax=Devosia subaequoris TaxID=395930 RepID=A0A7W6NC37_9HYPH|nr:lytic murein transglycosylase [Devosia subaequoris]MBB4052364.1 membrane-bound lytic murein transglycosylase B [Devosia subaequoris]MCP1209525.1 lytic murein transglycosylase [Devosia subaequoris]